MKTDIVARECRQWWAVTDDHSVELVNGWACHLFKDKESAKARAIQEIEERIAILEKKLRELKYLC